MSGFEQDQVGDEGVLVALNVQRALAALRRSWRLIALSVVVVTGLSVVVALNMQNQYEAAAVVQIDPRQKSITNLKGVISELNATSAAVDSEVEVIKSRAIALRVIDILKLRDDPEFNSRAGTRTSTEKSRQTGNTSIKPETVDVGSGLRGPLTPGLSRPQRDGVADMFSGRLGVQRVRSTLLIEISFTASDAEKSAKIANTIAEVYLASQLEAKQQASKFATGVLEEKLSTLRKTVAEAEHKVELFKSKNGLVVSEGQLLSEKQLARLMEQTVSARNATVAARAKYEQAKKLLDAGGATGTIGEVLQSQTVRQLKEQLALITRRTAEVATRYGSRHPEMQKVQAELADARASLRREISHLVANLENEYEVAKRSEANLGRNLDARKGEQTHNKEAGVHLKELQREAETSRQLFEVLLMRYKQTSETHGLQLPDARIVDVADTPSAPTGPKRKRMVALFLLAALFGSMGLVLVVEFATTGIGRAEEVEHVFDLAHLSSLPQVDELNGQPLNGMLEARLMLADPASQFSEAIRYMRREIDLRRQHDGPRIVMVASSLPTEGSSMVASNVAHHYAMTGGRTLLIDGDMRMAGLSRDLAPGCAVGLRDILAGGLPVEHAIMSDNKTTLHFLPASNGEYSTHSSPELLSTGAMGNMLHSLKEQFDVIVIDAPPLLPVIDGRILADYADQVVFVMSWRRTPKELAKKALRGLAVNYDKVVGIVVNKIAPSTLAEANGPEFRSRSPQEPNRQRAA